jgi:DUF4097 and DUF4098 domain-containing protein YvlB
MKITALAVIALTLAPGLVFAEEQKETETVDRTIAFSRGGTLKLKNFSGDVRITGTAGNDVVVHAVRTATRDRLDHVKLDISVNGSTVTIEANKRSGDWDERENNVVDTRLDIQVPAPTILDLDVFSSDLHVSDTTADIKAKTFSGEIDLDVSRASGTPDLRAETFSGDIKARMPANGSGQVEFRTFSGDLQSDLPLRLYGSSRKNMKADLGTGSGATLEFKTFSGDVRLLK